MDEFTGDDVLIGEVEERELLIGVVEVCPGTVAP